MHLSYQARGQTQAWSDAAGTWMVFAADPWTLMHMLDNGTLHASWKYFGSPDQADGLFLVAHPSVDRTTLDGLMDANGPLLPAGSAWLPMDIADVREFTTTDEDEIDSPATSP